MACEPENRKGVSFTEDLAQEEMERTSWSVTQKLLNPEKSESDYAVLVLNQPILCEPEKVKALWKNAALRVLVDGGSNRWLHFLETLKVSDLELPDIISGDFDSMTSRTREYFESGNVNIIFTPNQDETDFTKALRCVASVIETKKVNVKSVIALCENGGRFDQIMGNINTIHRSNRILQVPVILLSSECVTWALPPGKHRIVVTEDFIKKKYCCGLIPFCGPTRVTTRGLKWDLENHTMEINGLVSTSNAYADVEISIECDRHLVWTTQYSEVTR